MSENRSPSRARPTYDIWPALPALPRHGLGRRRIAFHRAIPAIPAAARRRPRLSARPPKAPSRGQTPGTATDPPTTLGAAATVSPRGGGSTTSTTLCTAADSASTNPSMPGSTGVNLAVADALAPLGTSPTSNGSATVLASVGSTLALGAPAASSPADPALAAPPPRNCLSSGRRVFPGPRSGQGRVGVGGGRGDP